MRKKKPTIFIIDDDEIFADCIEKPALKANPHLEIKRFTNAIEAMNSLTSPLPKLIFLDVLLPGVDGFTFLNELTSYPDTAKIPIILITSLKLPETDLSIYGIKAILNKETMKPSEVAQYVERYTN